MARISELLGQGAEAYGYRGARWTRARIQQVIAEGFGVSYHVDHVSYLMRKIGWTQQSQAAVEAWKSNWPTVEKKPSKKGKR